MSDSNFATALTCMDGRIAQPVIDWVKAQDSSVQYVDLITEAGMEGALANEKLANQEATPLSQFKFKAHDVSINGHGSSFIVIVGHEQCAGNPVDETQHIADIKKSVDLVKSWHTGAKIAGLYLKHVSDAKWEPQVIVPLQ